MDLTQSSTLTPFTPEGAEFDYGAFLRDDAMDYLDEDNSGSSVTVAGSPIDKAAAGQGREVVRANATPKQRLERRGHTKSRRGCFNCKRRRIKCQETRPACGHCVKTGLKCEYPALPQVTHQPHHQIPLFSLQDMRFFQHFLMQCYPAYPPGNEVIWTHEVPCLSQTHEYLMHALLALAASDLMQHDATLLPAAMAHRVKAIRAIKRRLADISRSTEVSYEESNAMVATCFALTFQSVMMDDGMAEFMTFIRGILIVGMQMWMKGVTPIFTNLINEDAENLIASVMETLPLVHKEWADGAFSAIQTLRPLCHEEVEIEYYEILMKWVQQLYTSSWEAYRTLRRHYGWWMMLPHDKFRTIIDPNNQVMLLLASHWIALKQIMAFITDTAERESRAKTPNGKGGDVDPGVIRWLKYINRQVDDDHQIYNHWPVWVEEQLDRDIRFFGKSM